MPYLARLAGLISPRVPARDPLAEHYRTALAAAGLVDGGRA